MEKEKFKALMQDILPSVRQISAELKKHEFPGMVSLCMEADGYIRIGAHESEWYLIKTSKEESCRLKCEMEEVLSECVTLE